MTKKKLSLNAVRFALHLNLQPVICNLQPAFS